jgi:FdhD protein
MKEFDVVSIENGLRIAKCEIVTEEIPFTIEVNGRELATLLASPCNLKQLAIGFLYTSGLIRSVESIRSLTVDTERWKAEVEIDEDVADDLAFKRVYTSGCGRGVIFHNPLDVLQRVSMPDGFAAAAATILDLMKQFLGLSEEHRKTRGVHSAALADRERILIFMDDIGRHNALDKAIGEALLSAIDLREVMAMTSGRISSEIVAKIMRSGSPVVVSAGVPTNQAIQLAKEIRMTLAGSARGRRMNIYCHHQRIL